MDTNIHQMRTQPPLLAPIFRSDSQARLLSVSLLDHERTLADLARHADVAYPTAHREVGRLIEAGILAERVMGRTRLIYPNEASALVAPLRQILFVSTGPTVLLRSELADIAGIENAFIYGSFAARLDGVTGSSPNDIDVMVIGTPNPDEIYNACARVEESAQRPVNPTILTRQEAGADSGFLNHVRASPIVELIGSAPWQ